MWVDLSFLPSPRLTQQSLHFFMHENYCSTLSTYSHIQRALWGKRGISMGDLLLFSVFPLTLPWDLMNSPQGRCHSPLEQSEITEALFLPCFVSDLSQPYFSACFLLTPKVVNPIERNGRCPNPEKYHFLMSQVIADPS